MDSVVGEHDLAPVGHGGDKGLEEGARGLHIGLVDELSDRELGSSINGDEEIELALRGLHFGDVDVEEADRIGLELLRGSLSPSTWGDRLTPWRLRQRCRDERVRRGIVGCRA